MTRHPLSIQYRIFALFSTLSIFAVYATAFRTIGWLRLVGSLKSYVSFAEYRLFSRALLQKRPIILRSLLMVATPCVSRIFFAQSMLFAANLRVGSEDLRITCVPISIFLDSFRGHSGPLVRTIRETRCVHVGFFSRFASILEMVSRILKIDHFTSDLEIEGPNSMPKQWTGTCLAGV